MPLPPFTENQQKKAIIWLLAASCLASSLILIFSPSERQIRLSGLAHADSLILQELSLFNISSDYIRTFNYPVTDQFTRKRYVVDLPVQVSKTHLHAELNRQLRPFGVTTIGYVNVPDDEMSLHVVYRDKIIRTLDLRIDPNYIRVPHPAKLLVYFDRRPTDSQLNRIRQLGIPVTIVLRSASRRSLVRWAESLPDEIDRAGIWFDNARSDANEAVRDDSELFRTLEAVSRVHTRPVLLNFTRGETGLSSDQKEQLRSKNITIAETADFSILSSEDRFEFDRRILNYSRLARQAGGPGMLIRGTDRTIDWLEEWIPRIQRGGVVFVSI